MVSAFLAIVFFVVTCRLLYVGVYVRHVWRLSVEELLRVLIKACVFLLTLCVCFVLFVPQRWHLFYTEFLVSCL